MRRRRMQLPWPHPHWESPPTSPGGSRSGRRTPNALRRCFIFGLAKAAPAYLDPEEPSTPFSTPVSAPLTALLGCRAWLPCRRRRCRRRRPCYSRCRPTWRACRCLAARWCPTRSPAGRAAPASAAAAASSSTAPTPSPMTS